MGPDPLPDPDPDPDPVPVPDPPLVTPEPPVTGCPRSRFRSPSPVAPASSARTWSTPCAPRASAAGPGPRPGATALDRGASRGVGGGLARRPRRAARRWWPGQGPWCTSRGWSGPARGGVRPRQPARHRGAGGGGAGGRAPRPAGLRLVAGRRRAASGAGEGRPRGRAAPVSAYGRSKLAGEAAVRALGDSARWSVLRPPAIYGPRDIDVLQFFRLAARGAWCRCRPASAG